jgi:hypothetical protein
MHVCCSGHAARPSWGKDSDNSDMIGDWDGDESDGARAGATVKKKNKK